MSDKIKEILDEIEAMKVKLVEEIAHMRNISLMKYRMVMYSLKMMCSINKKRI